MPLRYPEKSAVAFPNQKMCEERLVQSVSRYQMWTSHMYSDYHPVQHDSRAFWQRVFLARGLLEIAWCSRARGGLICLQPAMSFLILPFGLLSSQTTREAASNPLQHMPRLSQFFAPSGAVPFRHTFSLYQQVGSMLNSARLASPLFHPPTLCGSSGSQFFPESYWCMHGTDCWRGWHGLGLLLNVIFLPVSGKLVSKHE